MDIRAPHPQSQTIESRRPRRHLKHRLATGLLLGAVAVFLSLRFLPSPGFAARLLNAAAEAAIVGGLADWFAITALFRHPLGLPIPHTAIIPTRKNDIGRALGKFVRDSFLDPAVLTERLRRHNAALAIAQWLDTEDSARFVAERIAALVPPLLSGLKDSDIHAAMRNAAREGLARIDIVPIADGVLDHIVETGRHMDIVDALLAVIRPSLQALKEPIAERVGERTGRFFPSYFDLKIGQGIVNGAGAWLDAVRTPGSDERARLDSWLRKTIANFRGSPDYPRLLGEARAAVMNNPGVLNGLGAIWDEIKRELLADAAAQSSKTAEISARIVRSLGRLLQQMPVTQDYLNAAIERVLVDYIAPWRIQIGNYIAEIIESWDGPKTAAIIESHVGNDLQYIRINGTLVGAAIGAGLFLIGAAIGAL
ncbi:MAG TPA: DUF445 domain-containing protein [Micropepsaceae bacterium]|jgi:uncharacterized membrane-anchored protein YjiN (DUF445 family)|nr:DUF445 domain-containing protein [Micropepsaceae bacterium]